MKVLVQRVLEASCTVEGITISSIKKGLLLFVGFTHEDTIEDVHHLAKKIANLRVFEDENGKLNINIIDKQYSILSISQFTLYGDTSKGNRPSFTMAMIPNQANVLYIAFNSILQNTYNIPTFGGRFGEYMDISLRNDGPVTLMMESIKK